MRAAAHQSLQSSCLEWLQREIRTSHLQQPRWPTRSPCRESPSCPPRSTSTSTSTSPASEPLPPGTSYRGYANNSTSWPFATKHTSHEDISPPASNLSTFISESLLLKDVIKVSNACMVTI